jgi:hypothetical protein
MVVAYFFLLIPVLLAALVVGAWIALVLSTRTGMNAIRNAPFREFLGPGGPDDPSTVLVPRDQYEELLATQREPAGVVRVLRKTGDEQLPRPDEQTEHRPAA